MDNKLKGVLYMITSAMMFALMQIVIAITSDTVPIFEQLFFRNLIASFISLYSIRKLNLPIFGKRENLKLLFLRASFGFLGMITVFYSVAHASQGDAAIMGKMSPFVVTVLVFFFLKEKITKPQIIGLIIAFVGAFFVANPEFNSDTFPIFVAFLSAVFSGIAYTFLSFLKGKEHPSVIIFFFSVFSIIITIPLMIPSFVLVSFADLLLLILIGIFAAMGQIFITKAYNASNASEVSIYNYSGIIFSMIFGFVFLGQSVKSTSVIGGILVIISALIVYFGNRKQEKLSN